jgi:hypothetical protein
MNVAVTYSGLLAPLTAVALRARILDLELAMLMAPRQAECPVRNLFSPGEYRREMTIPAGVVLTGAEHKTRHLNIVSRGRIVVWTETGMREIVAPYEFWSEPGTKRAGYALEETVWTTVHPNPDDCQDMEVLVERLTTSKYSDLLENRTAIEHQGRKPWLSASAPQLT